MNPEHDQTPATSEKTETPVTTPKLARKPGKKLLLILSIVGGVVLLAIVAAIIYFALFTVSKADYRTAANTASDVSKVGSKSFTAVSKVAVISTTTTEIVLKSNVESARDSLTEYKEENGKLTDLKALRDSESKEAYDAYIEKFNAYVTFSETYIDSVEKVLPAIIKCEEIARTTTSISGAADYNTAVAPCEDGLNAVKDVKDKDINLFLEAYKKNAADVKATVAKGEGASNLQRITLRTELLKATSDLRKAQSTAVESIRDRLTEVKPYDTLNAFYDLTADKSK